MNLIVYLKLNIIQFMQAYETKDISVAQSVISVLKYNRLHIASILKKGAKYFVFSKGTAPLFYLLSAHRYYRYTNISQNPNNIFSLMLSSTGHTYTMQLKIKICSLNLCELCPYYKYIRTTYTTLVEPLIGGKVLFSVQIC